MKDAIDLVMIWFLGLLAAVTLLFWGEIRHPVPLASFYFAGLLFWTAVPRLIRTMPENRKRVFRIVFCCVTVPLVFTSLGFLLHHVSPDDRHWYLLIADRRVFDGDPVRLAKAWENPFLTEILQISYSSFYFLPIVLGWFLFRAGRWKELDHTILVIVLGFYLSYLGYFLVPARSPNEVLPGLWQEGWITAGSIAEILRSAEILKRDCFPSGHFQMTLLTLLLAWRYSRPAFWILLPLGVGLSLGTWYLGYHYLVDLGGGALFAGLTLWVCPKSGFP